MWLQFPVKCKGSSTNEKVSKKQCSALTPWRPESSSQSIQKKALAKIQHGIVNTTKQKILQSHKSHVWESMLNNICKVREQKLPMLRPRVRQRCPFSLLFSVTRKSWPEKLLGQEITGVQR